jgi:hypothetical protein
MNRFFSLSISFSVLGLTMGLIYVASLGRAALCLADEPGRGEVLITQAAETKFGPSSGYSSR